MKHSVTPLVMVNLRKDQYLEFPMNHVVAFAQKDNTKGEVFQIEQIDTTPKHWVPWQPWQPVTEITKNTINTDLQEMLATEQLVARVSNIEAETDLHKISTSSSNFIKSPAEVEAHRQSGPGRQGYKGVD